MFDLYFNATLYILGVIVTIIAIHEFFESDIYQKYIARERDLSLMEQVLENMKMLDAQFIVNNENTEKRMKNIERKLARLIKNSESMDFRVSILPRNQE